MSDINVGDRVICIDIDNLYVGCPLVKNREYIVYERKPGHCSDTVDVGIFSSQISDKRICRCGAVYKTGEENNIWYFSITRFVKVAPKQEKISAIKLTEQLVLSEN